MNRDVRSSSFRRIIVDNKTEEEILMQPELIANYECIVGENPLWHTDEKRLYWTDCETGRLFRYDPATGHHEQCYKGSRIGGFTLQADGSLLLFMDEGSVMIWRNGEIEKRWD